MAESCLLPSNAMCGVCDTASDWMKRTKRSGSSRRKRGKTQARAAGQALLPLKGKFDVIYSSPLVRTLQTAHEISQALGLPIRITGGLSTCAAAVRAYGFKALQIPSQNNVAAVKKRYSSLACMRALPVCDFIEDSFPQCVERLCISSILSGHGNQTEDTDVSMDDSDESGHVSKYNNEKCTNDEGESGTGNSSDRVRAENSEKKEFNILCVTHREGFRRLSTMSQSERIRGTPYCSIAKFEYRYYSGKSRSPARMNEKEKKANKGKMPKLESKQEVDDEWDALFGKEETQEHKELMRAREDIKAANRQIKLDKMKWKVIIDPSKTKAQKAHAEANNNQRNFK